MIWSVRQGVRSTEILAQYVLKGEIKFRQVKQPPGLLVIQIVRLVEVGQVLVISKDLDCGGGTEKVVVPGIQCSHDGEQFSVVDVIVALSGAKCLGQIGTRTPFVINVLLQ